MQRCFLLFLLVFLFLPSCAARRPHEQEYLHDVACRIVTKSTGTQPVLTPLADVNLDTVSGDPAYYTFGTEIGGARRLVAVVRHVRIDMPRDRFNVALLLDGKPLIRLNHVDLDIYLETVIDDRTYILHCFPEFE